ncbi:MAG: TrkA family potassium uptake protein [Phycisphaerae bacterium]
MTVLVIGGGKVLYFLCRTFIAKGHEVTVINRDHDECVWLARHLKATIVEGDGSDSGILEDAGADAADALIAVTPNDQDNLVVCQLANRSFHVPRVLALVNDPDNEEAFRRLGVPAVSTTHTMASLIEQRAALDEITNLIPAAEGKVNISEVALKQASPLAGHQLAEVALPENALVACVIRGEEAIIPRGGTQLQVGDRIVVITLPENHGAVLKAITGEET